MNSEPLTNSVTSAKPATIAQRVRRLPWSMFWALADQGVVSIARLVTSILIGRYGSKEELGIYSLGFTILTLVVCLQESFVNTPYTIFVSRYPTEQQPKFAANLLVISKLLTLVVMLCLGTNLALLYFLNPTSSLVPILLALLVILPFSLLKEFSRRWQIAHLKMKEATFLDSLNTLILLGGLGVLYQSQSLTAFNAFMVTGLAALLVSIVWSVRNLKEFDFNFDTLKHTIKSCLSFGKWVAGENILSGFQYFFANWFLFFACGEQELGDFAACMTIVMLCNPFLLGITGFLATRSSQEYTRAGESAVRSMVNKFNVMTTMVMIAFCAGIYFFGDFLLATVFNGRIQNQHWTLVILSIAMVGLGISHLTSCGLRAINRPEFNFYASIIGLVVTAAAHFFFISAASPPISATAFLAGNVAMAGFRWWKFLPAKVIAD